MSFPRNNLEEVRRKKGELASCAATPGLPSKSFTFKPAATSSSAASNVTVRKGLPSFKSPGFGKPTAAVPTRKPAELIASSSESPATEVPIKRSSSDDSISSDPSSLPKRAKKEMTANKENVLPSPTKNTGQIRAVSPLPSHSSSTRMHDTSNEEEPWSNTALPTNVESFVLLGNDLPHPESASSSKLPVSTEYFSSTGSKGDHSTLSGDLSQFPDLLTKSAVTLTQLLRANIAHNRQFESEILENVTGKAVADTFMLNIFRKELEARISAILQSLALHENNGKLLGASTSLAVPDPSTPAPTSTLVSSIPSSSSTYVQSTPAAGPSDSDRLVSKPITRTPEFQVADEDEINVPHSDDALWDNVDPIVEEDVASFPLDPDPLPNSSNLIEATSLSGLDRTDQTATPYYAEIMRVLKKVFGFHSFRNHQLEAINATLAGRDVFVLMPTGGGKSLCFQCPAACRGGKTRGVTVVVSPLIALMQDQVKALESKGVDVVLWNSEKTSDDVHEIKQRLLADKKPAMVYVTPEKLKESYALKSVLVRLYRDAELARFVIDEAHCISSWGRDFRDAYMALDSLREDYPDVPIMALTATAKRNVVDDIVHRLKMRNPVILKESFNRPNLHYDIRPKPKNVLEEIAAFIKSRYPNKCGIIYALSRNSCEDIARELREKHGLKAKHYHAKMNSQDKRTTQTDWKSGRCDIIVATIAFGMGVDKSDVRYVIHYTMPKSLDGYYQETGRAGRDGQASECVLYYSYADVAGLVKMIGNNKDGPKLSPEEEKRQREDVYAVLSYCQDTVTCRRVHVLRYFGETFDSANCHRGCNNCTQPGTKFEQDFTQAAHAAAKLTKDILESSNKLTTQNHCQDVFLGLKYKEIKSRGHHELALHGGGRGLPKEIVERLFSKLLEISVFQHVSVPNNSGYHNLYLELGPAIDDFLAKMPTVTLPVKHETVRSTVAPKKTKKQVPVKKLGSAAKPKKLNLPEDEDPISFYEDSDNSLDHDDAIEFYSTGETLPLSALQTSRKQAEKIEESHHDDCSSLYEDLKAACHAKLKGCVDDIENFLPDSTLQLFSLLKPKDPFAFRELLKQDNQDRFPDPAELKFFISDSDTQLREVVLTTIMKHEVSARQRSNTAKSLTSFNATAMHNSYAFKS